MSTEPTGTPAAGPSAPRSLFPIEDTAPSTSVEATGGDGALEEKPEASEVDKPERLYPNGQDPRLRYLKPYWWPYRTFVKNRWIGRRLLEVISTEFRDRSVDYYKHALESGVTRVNGVVAPPDFILRDGDRIDNTVHRHEPPVTNDPILVLHVDKEKGFVMVSKPGSLPVHATGRYFRHTVLEIMQSDHGIKCFSVNRLDRLTSGLMILALTSASSRELANEFIEGRITKEYVARCKGRFPDGVVIVDKPLLTVDRQMGLVIITPEGKVGKRPKLSLTSFQEAKTMFKRLSYDAERDQSILHCRPLTGRTHQIRVHLQYLGHPIANDPLYSQTAIWGPHLGKGGVELVPHADSMSSEMALASRVVAQRLDGMTIAEGADGETPKLGQQKRPWRKGDEKLNPPKAKPVEVDLNDREFANIDLTSPIRLSTQARNIIAKLRKQKDEIEDWVKWKEVIFRAKEAQDEMDSGATTPSTSQDIDGEASTSKPKRKEHPRVPKAIGLTEKAKLPDPIPDEHVTPLEPPVYLPPGFCQQCFVPVADDPDPETLFIFLHALRYTTPKLGEWATPLPRWAEEGWEGDWRGWSDQKAPAPFPDEVEEVVDADQLVVAAQ